MLSFIADTLFQMYYIIIFIAIIVSYILINFVEKLSKLDRLYLLSCYIFSIFGMIIGAKILCMVENIICHKSEVIAIFSGFSYMGGVLGYIIFVKIYNKIYKNVPKKINALLLLAIPIIYSISKIACYNSGCCNGITNISIQLIECLTYFSIFIVFSYIHRKHNKKELIASISIIVLCMSRYIIDFFRTKRNIILLDLTLIQIICIGIIIVKLIQIYNKRKEKSCIYVRQVRYY